MWHVDCGLGYVDYVDSRASIAYVDYVVNT
jgi:hypothetical protein